MLAAPTVEVSVFIPCLNEAVTVGDCVEKAIKGLEAAGVSGEVIVADNGATDGSLEIATRKGARIVPVATKGYGHALRAGIEAARGQFIIMGVPDDAYEFGQIPNFVARWAEAFGVVMGNR